MFNFDKDKSGFGAKVVSEISVPQTVAQIRAKAAAGRYGDASPMIDHFMQIAQEEGRVAREAGVEAGRYEASSFNGGHVHCG